MFQIHLLGGFRLSQNGPPIDGVSSQRQQALLAYLALHRHTPHTRRHLSFLFWPDSSEKQARTNLRNLFHQLRSNFPDIERLLSSSTKSVQWRADADCKLDVAEFENALEQVEAAGENGQRIQEALERAVSLYAGDLLPGFYEDWVLAAQERLRTRFLQALDRLIVLLEDQRDYVRAIEYTVKLLHHEPLHEDTYRRLMRLYALNQDRAAALSVYARCAEVFERELGISPSTETLDLYQRLLGHKQVPEQPEHAQSHSSPRFRTVSVAPTVTITPLVGRQAAWQQLLTCWRSAAKGKAQLMLISGEAGIGKTRLAEELMAWIARQGISSAIARCYAVEDSLSYGPIVSWLRSEPLQRRLPDLEQVWQIELARLLPELHRPWMPQPEPLTQGWQRQRLFDAVAQAVMAVRPPLLLVLDDFQWCDAETLEWLHYWLRTCGQARVLVAATLRSEEIHADHPLSKWLHVLQRQGMVSEIALGPLDQDETAQLANLVAGETLEADVNSRLYHETEGHPLFVVEVTRSGPHLARSLPPPSGAPELPAPWPTAMQLVIESRLDQLSSTSRELINLAAVIGRRFTVDILAAASGVADQILADGLDEALQRRLIREQGPDGYDFSHDRLREVAYSRLSQIRRRVLHRQVAEALETVFADRLDDICGQLAVHYERAGPVEKAIGYYRQAAETALRLYAHQDAIHLLKRGLEVLKRLPESAGRNNQELALQLMLGSALAVTRGYAAAEVESVYNRARTLAQCAEEVAWHFSALWGLRVFYANAGHSRLAVEWGWQLLNIAREAEDEELVVRALQSLGTDLLHIGEFTLARDTLEQGVTLYSQRKLHLRRFEYVTDPATLCLAILAPVSWILGYPEQAQAYAHRAVALIDEREHPGTNAVALNYLSWYHWMRGDAESNLVCAERSLALCDKHGFTQLLGGALLSKGNALVASGKIEEGIALLEQGIEMWESTGARNLMPLLVFMLADACAKAGQPERALALLEDALTEMTERGERRAESELLRLKASLLHQQGAAFDHVEAVYREALEIARVQQGKLLELRAAIDLSRFWQGQGRREEAHQLLTDVYGWFTEGFDIPDLQEARTLLKILL